MVESSNIDWVNWRRDSALYEGPRGRLEVGFKNGGVYEYADVPLALYQIMTEGAPGIEVVSVGKFFNWAVKGKFASTKIG